MRLLARCLAAIGVLTVVSAPFDLLERWVSADAGWPRYGPTPTARGIGAQLVLGTLLIAGGFVLARHENGSRRGAA